MITEKKLLDNYKYITKCGDLCSIINGEEYYWGYGAGSGFNYKRVSLRAEAENIRIKRRNGFIYNIKLPKKCMNKEANNLVQAEILKFIEEVIQ